MAVGERWGQGEVSFFSTTLQLIVALSSFFVFVFPHHTPHARPTMRFSVASLALITLLGVAVRGVGAGLGVGGGV